MVKESNKTLEEYEARKRKLNYSEYEICLALAKDWQHLCPRDPAGEQLSKLTFRTTVVYKKQFVWCEEFKSITERTAVRLFRTLSDQIRLDGIKRARFRERPEEKL